MGKSPIFNKILLAYFSHNLGDSGCPCIAERTGITAPWGIWSRFFWFTRQLQKTLSGRMQNPCFGGWSLGKSVGNISSKDDEVLCRCNRIEYSRTCLVYAVGVRIIQNPKHNPTVPCGVLQSTTCVRPKFQTVVVEELIMRFQDCVCIVILCEDPNQDQVVFGEYLTTVNCLYNIPTTVPPTYILRQSIEQSVQSPWCADSEVEGILKLLLSLVMS